MIGPEGRVVGFIWADDPADHCLPSRDRLRALRMFANEATSAVLSARAHARARYLADHDELTALGNRRALIAETSEQVARAATSGSTMAVVVVDLDRFKHLNDACGHAAGDIALRAAGDAMRRALRDSDSAFRVGGDEFAIVLPGADADAARRVADRITSSIGSQLVAGHRLAASAGVAVYPDDGADPDGLLRRADEEMYQQKRRAPARTSLPAP